MKHPTPWRIEKYTGHRPGYGGFMGRIVDANGELVYKGPYDYYSLSRSAATRILHAVNKPVRWRAKL